MSKTTIWLLAILALLLVAGAAGALGLASKIGWYVVGSGGGRSTSASFGISGTMGQAMVGSSTSAGFRLGAGYWPAIAGEAEPSATPTLTTTAIPTATPTSTATPTVSPTATATATTTATRTPTATTTPPTYWVYLSIILRDYP